MISKMSAEPDNRRRYCMSSHGNDKGAVVLHTAHCTLLQASLSNNMHVLPGSDTNVFPVTRVFEQCLKFLGLHQFEQHAMLMSALHQRTQQSDWLAAQQQVRGSTCNHQSINNIMFQNPRKR